MSCCTLTVIMAASHWLRCSLWPAAAGDLSPPGIKSRCQTGSVWVIQLLRPTFQQQLSVYTLCIHTFPALWSRLQTSHISNYQSDLQTRNQCRLCYRLVNANIKKDTIISFRKTQLLVNHCIYVWNIYALSCASLNFSCEFFSACKAKKEREKQSRTAVKQQITRFISPVTSAVSASLSHRTAGKGSYLLKES